MLLQKAKRKYSPNVVASFLPRIEVLASRIDRFMPMFDKLIEQGIDKNSVRGMLKTLSHIFIKEPHFLWAVKQYRGFLADRNGQKGAEQQSANFEFIRYRLADFRHVYKNAEADNFRPILDYKIKQNESAPTLLNNLLNLEQDVLDKRQDEGIHRIVDVDPQTEKTFIKFKDRWEWVLLDREYCAKEKEAMGHCGNAGYRSGDRLLSLREPISKGKQRPHLTFILHNGFLGEMKGYKNNKPAPKFHKYIIPLLKDNRIKSLIGGGYKPQNNFHLEDLKKAEKNELLQEKPTLDIHHYLKEATDVPLGEGEYISSDKNSIVMEKFQNINEFCQEYRLPDLEDDSFFGVDGFYGDVEDVLAKIAEHSPKKFWELYENRLKKADNHQEIIDDGLNPETKNVKDAIEILLNFLDEDGTIEQSAMNAYMSAEETALRDSFYKNYHKWLDELDVEDDYGNKYYLIWDGYIDHPVELATNIENLSKQREKPNIKGPADFEVDRWQHYSAYEFDEGILSEIFFEELFSA